MIEGDVDDANRLIQELRSARSRTSVLKIALATLRSALPTTPIFLFEGSDDKIVYFNWISRLRGDLEYEPFICNGKGPLLAFRDSLQSDLNGLNSNLFYFVDRDFDDLQGYAAGPDIYMPDAYSVENYLIETQVLDRVLTNDFHCEGKPAVRANICALYERALDEFIGCMRDINRRIFIGRNLRLLGNLPHKISVFVTVELDAVLAKDVELNDLIPYRAPVNDDQSHNLRIEFDTLNPRSRHRGKYMYSFFITWLNRLADAKVAKTTNLFSAVTSTNVVRTNEFSIGSFAAKAAPPSGLQEFLAVA